MLSGGELCEIAGGSLTGGFIITPEEYIEKSCTNFLTKVIPVLGGSGAVTIGRYITLFDPVGEYPCWFADGMGLYLLFINEFKDDPNLNLHTMRYPPFPTVHIGDFNTSGRVKIQSSGGIFDGYGNPVEIKKGMGVFGKILDSHYLDNFGLYRINFLQGVLERDRLNMFESIRRWVLKDMIVHTKDIFNGIIQNPYYKNAITALLILYVVITALSFLMGFVKAQSGELILRSVKIAVVLSILHPDAWTFFNTHLFQLYLKGVDQIINVAVGNGGYFDPDAPLDFLDKIYGILNEKTWTKMQSLLFANFILGSIWIVFFFMCYLFMLIMLFVVFLSYICSMVTLYFITLFL